VVAHWFEWVWNRREARVIDLLFPEDGVAWGLGDEPVRGPAAFRAFHAALFTAFAPLHFETLRTVTEGDLTVIHGRLDVTVNGSTVGLDGIGIGRVVDGKIVEAWNSWSFVPLLIAQGVVSPEQVQRALAGG
jgi:limonene-1,2-epoxide hydrolase